VNQLQRKLGPLALWQWIAIGAAAGLGIALWRRSHGAQDVAAAVTPSDAQYNPIDPTTGLPFAGGVSTGPATDTGTAGASGNLQDLLNNFGALESLLAGLQQLQPVGPAIDTTGGDSDGSVAVQTGTTSAKKSPLERAKAALATGKLGPVNRQRLKAAGYTDKQIDLHLKSGTPLAKPQSQQHPKNPGHTVTHHGGGKKTPSSSAPHNPRQHVNQHPPSHQRHEPTKHHSAQHPAAKTPAPKKAPKARKGKH
jgi:hypothetical protein